MAGTSDKVGAEFDKADRADFFLQFASKLLTDVGVKANLKAPDPKKLADSIQKSKKKAQVYVTLDGQKLGVEVRVGSDEFAVISIDLDAEKNVKKHREILENLSRKTKLITEQEVWKWHEKHLDDEELSFFAGTTSGKPNWTTARKLISTMVNIKFIGTMKKERLPAIDKELARLKVEIPAKRKEFVAVGGKF